MFSFRTTPLEDQLDKALTDGKVGCFCTQNCWDTSSNRYMYQIFQERGNLVRLFQPEDAELTPGTNHIHFDSESLKGLNAIVVEIQDVGSRYFNYTKDIFRLLNSFLIPNFHSRNLCISKKDNLVFKVERNQIPRTC